METQDNRANPGGPLWLRLIFAIFMVLFYIAFGVLLFTPFFNRTFENMPEGLHWVRWFIAVVLVIYGFFRGWRLYKGINQSRDEE